jgi:hypothetical protein
MKQKRIRFLTQEDNLNTAAPKVTEETTMAGSISKRGSLVFAQKVAEELGMTTSGYFRVGVPEGKKKLTALYLISAGDDHANAFPVQKVGRGYGIGLAGILAKSGVHYRETKLRFTIAPVDLDENGSAGFELRIQEPPAPPVEGAKKRGRPAKVQPAPAEE